MVNKLEYKFLFMVIMLINNFSSFSHLYNFSAENMTRTMPEEEKLLTMDEDLKNFYKEAFDDFDWNRNGRIATGVSKAGMAGTFV